MLAVDVLYNFPLGLVGDSSPGFWNINDMANEESLIGMVEVYGSILSVAGGILLIFTPTGLVVQSIQLQNPNLSLGPINQMQDVLWIGFVAGLVGGFLYFDYGFNM